MKEAINQCKLLFGEGPIKIGAQLYLKEFYGSFGFEAIGSIYLEDDIEHIHMIRK
jgi:ElaA protein